MSEPRLPDLARCFERHLRVENRSDRTVRSSLEPFRPPSASWKWPGWPPGARKATTEPATGHRPPPTRMPTAPVTANRAMVGERAWHDPPGSLLDRGLAEPAHGPRRSRWFASSSLTSERQKEGTSSRAQRITTRTRRPRRCWTSGRRDGRAPRCRSWSRGRVLLGALQSELLAAESHSPVH